jgi:hypothetical protein
MPQIANPRSLPPRKNIDAGIPKNISELDRSNLESVWNEAARKREEEIARETKIPEESSLTLKYQLRRFGKWWNAYAPNEKGKMVPLLNAPSLLSSAIDALTDRMGEEASR